MQHRIQLPVFIISISSIISLRIVKWLAYYIIFGDITHPKQNFQDGLLCIIGYTDNIFKYFINITIVLYVLMSRKWFNFIYAFQSKVQNFFICFSCTNQEP